MPPIVLASSSPYRRQLLARIVDDFEYCSPDIDESSLPTEAPAARAERLAMAKARAVAERFPQHLIIGSDQVAALGDLHLDKPGSFEPAVRQLSLCSGRQVDFHTGLCLLNSASGTLQIAVETFTVQFRPLSPAQIERYLRREQPFDCAGSFKMEGLGIALFSSLSGRDPNTLIGLPLIRLVEMLDREGIAIP